MKETPAEHKIKWSLTDRKVLHPKFISYKKESSTPEASLICDFAANFVKIGLTILNLSKVINFELKVLFR